MTWPLKYQSPLLLDGWLEFNRYKWGVTPLKLRLTECDRELPAIDAVLYLDKKGRIVHPPLNPYMPVVFSPTPTDKVTRLCRQWLQTSTFLVEEFTKRGVKGSVAFCPEVVDVRPWTWHGFLAEVRYTLYIDLPYNLQIADKCKRTEVRRAKSAGYTCSLATRAMFSEVVECFAHTETRQGFSYQLSVKDLEMASDVLGEDVFRVYACRSPTGVLAYCDIVLTCPGSSALGWIAGTRKDALGSGAAQLLIHYMLDDLAQQGVRLFDFVGANLPSVSAQKAEWGGRLVPYYAIRPLNVRTLAALVWKIISRYRKRS